jgi:hypothetical protein
VLDVPFGEDPGLVRRMSLNVIRHNDPFPQTEPAPP